MVDTHIEALHVLLRETLLKKGFPSNSLPKTFSSVFSARGTPSKEKTELFFCMGYPLQKKQSWKSLERGLGLLPAVRGDAQRAEGRAAVSGNLSPERFAPVVCINFCTSTGFMIRRLLTLRLFCSSFFLRIKECNDIVLAACSLIAVV